VRVGDHIELRQGPLVRCVVVAGLSEARGPAPVAQALYAETLPVGGTAGAGIMMSSTTNLGVFFGSGAPTIAAAQGSLYLRTDGSSTSTRLYVNTTGSTTWTNVTTAI
jgi:hypothetical protein